MKALGAIYLFTVFGGLLFVCIREEGWLRGIKMWGTISIFMAGLVFSGTFLAS